MIINNSSGLQENNTNLTQTRLNIVSIVLVVPAKLTGTIFELINDKIKKFILTCLSKHIYFLNKYKMHYLALSYKKIEFDNFCNMGNAALCNSRWDIP